MVHDEWTQVPRANAFRDIVISMYFKEDNHPGRPHFHTRHAGLRATYDIRSLQPIAGRLHPSANRLVVESTNSSCDATGPWCAPRRRRPELIPCNELSTLMPMATMEIAPDLMEAKPTEGCNVWLRWEDGLEAEVDFSDLLALDGVFLPLRDPNFFRRVRVDDSNTTIEWPGEVDICPDTLYRRTEQAAGVAA
jgi:Protein of unknown function (DUF2442)/Domain of unknown function (DUF4160)